MKRPEEWREIVTIYGSTCGECGKWWPRGSVVQWRKGGGIRCAPACRKERRRR